MLEQLKEIICNYVEVEPEQIQPESRFMEDLGFTSFDFMSMLGELEDTFEVEVDQQTAAGIRTVQEAVDYLEKLTGERLMILDAIGKRDRKRSAVLLREHIMRGRRC